MKTCPEFMRRSSSIPGMSGITCCVLLWLLLVPALPAASYSSADQQVQQAVTLLEQQQYALALDLLGEIEAVIANPEQLKQLFAVAYLGRGYQLLAAGDYPAAGEAFFAGRRYDEEDVRSWQGEAMALLRQGRHADAVSLLEQALGIAPQNANLYHLLGQACYADGRMAEAMDALTRSSELGGGDAVAQFLAKVRHEWQVESEMEQAVRGHFQLSFPDGDQAVELSSEILDVLEDAYAELGSELNYYPDVRVPVLLYTDNDFATITHSPDWAGAVYDGKIRLPVGGLERMNDQLAALLYHEYMHVLVHFRANRQAPVWLNEGLAEMAGRQMYAPPLAHRPKLATARQLLSWDDLAGPFTALPEDQVVLAYEQSYSLVHFLVERFGWHTMTELLQNLGEQQPWQTAVATTYRDYGLDWAGVIAEWQGGLN